LNAKKAFAKKVDDFQRKGESTIAELLNGSTRMVGLVKLESDIVDKSSMAKERQKLATDTVLVYHQQDKQRDTFQKAKQDFSSLSTRSIDRLVRKEMWRSKGIIGEYKEQLKADKRKSKSKATQAYIQNFEKIKETGTRTIELLENNEALMKQKHHLQHELDIQKLATDRAELCKQDLENQVRDMARRYFEKAEAIMETREHANALRRDEDLKLRKAKQTIQDRKDEAEKWLHEWREKLEQCERTKMEIRDARQEAHDMFSGDSVAWSITAALPAIRGQRMNDSTSSVTKMDDIQKSENDLELLLSALHLSSRRDRNADTPRRMTPRVPTTPRSRERGFRNSPRGSQLQNVAT